MILPCKFSFSSVSYCFFFLLEKKIKCWTYALLACNLLGLKLTHPKNAFLKKHVVRTAELGLPWWSVQWLRICLAMQGTPVGSLVWEDPTCRGATKPVHHNYWAHVLQPLKAARLESVLPNERPLKREAHLRPAMKSNLLLPQLVKPMQSNEDPAQQKID